MAKMPHTYGVSPKDGLDAQKEHHPLLAATGSSLGERTGITTVPYESLPARPVSTPNKA
jgi:hypothetical protein